ncbi:MAG: RNA polymerase sigma factor [Haloarculaceae archaeon]
MCDRSELISKPCNGLFDYERDGPGLSRLTDAEREVYEAVDEGEYGPREYARRTDRSPGTVSNLLRRAREKVDEGGAS